MGDIVIIKPGLYTTVQDEGRTGYGNIGIPPGGAMDRYSYIMGNYIVGNSRGEASLESTLLGPEIEFRCDTEIAITGGDLSPKINGEGADMWSILRVKSGDRLSFGEIKSGARAYIAFRGGIDVPTVMGSRSTYTRGMIGGYSGRALKEGDCLELISSGISLERQGRMYLSQKYIPIYESEIELRVVLGPQEDKFSDRGLKTFLEEEFVCLSQSDRMGYRVSGPSIETIENSDIVSDGIALGAIQISNSGHPIIMMADRQTVGGYAKIGCVITADIPKVAQSKSGDKFRFKNISIEEAQIVYNSYFNFKNKIK